MKAASFWYQTPKLMAKLLLPFAALFWLGGFLRRLISSPYKAKVPLICVGNIVVGGAGKTPTCLALADLLLQQGAKPVFVTRGYGGSECGPLRVDPTIHTAAQVGDEALLLARVAPVWIGRCRKSAIKAAEADATHILMDDGLQNPSIKPNTSFLVMDGAVGIGNGYILPAGPLRESLDSALERVDAVILIGNEDTQNIAQQVHKPVLHAQIRPNLSAYFTEEKVFFAFAGIGRPEKFYRTCHEAGLNLIGTEDFPDHHVFTARELVDLETRALEKHAALLTTEKDWVRLPAAWQAKVTALPIKLVFDIPELPRSYLK